MTLKEFNRDAKRNKKKKINAIAIAPDEYIHDYNDLKKKIIRHKIILDALIRVLRFRLDLKKKRKEKKEDILQFL